MATEKIVLSGDALLGVDQENIPRGLLSQLPEEVCLGRRRPKARPMALKASAYFSPERQTSPPPTSTNWRAKAASALARMYLNDQQGDCVIAGKAHAIAIWTANDAGTAVQATDQEIQQQYRGICGPGDNGCVITDVLDVMRSKGFLAGGKYYKIDGYVSVDWTNPLLVKTVQAIFGASTIGINLPEAWTQNAVWDVTNTRIVGGHDVTPIDYDDKGVYVSSWGRVYLITWAAFSSRNWLEEMYALLSPDWYGSDKLAPSGIDAAALAADLQKLANGVIPDVGPPPQPPDPGPVPPPAPPGPSPDLQLKIDDLIVAEIKKRAEPGTKSALRSIRTKIDRLFKAGRK